MNSIDERILILASTRKDSISTEKLLRSAHLTSFICESLDSLEEEIERGAGAIMLAREVVTPANGKILVEALSRQPSWSHLPIVILTSSGDISQAKSEALKILETLRNATILERPVRLTTLLSVLKSAIADRSRQYKVRDLMMALEKSREEAVRANRAKSEFLANMSHEIRTPLTAILGYAEFILESGLSVNERRKYTATIRKNSQLLSSLIDDILDLAKIEAGRLEVERIGTPLHGLINDAVSALHLRAQQKQIELRVEIAADVPAAINTDPFRLKQIIINVVGNAVKFTDHGYVVVRVSAPTKESKLTIEVADTGIGVSPEQQARLFQAFSQADNSTTREFGGTGLGLTLSRQLARALGGDLILKKSALGSGSVFKITVDPGAPSHVSEAPLKISPKLDAGGELVGTKVLVVEDSPDIQLLIGRMLEQAGASVELAGDGVEGLNKALNGDFNVVLMDIQMPKMDGQEAATQLKQQGFKPPIIALTAHALKEHRERYLDAGCDGYLSKPVDRATLIRTVSSLTVGSKS